jgi:restriction system protein
MAVFSGEVTFKVKFNNLGVPASMYSSAIIYKACAEQVYASAPWSSIGHKNGSNVTGEQFDKELVQLIEYYGKIINLEIRNEESSYSQGLFYMESQIEDFIINNWDNTELGKKYDLIYENGNLISKQFKNEIGIIDILAGDKLNKNYVVIELKRNQTSDDTFGKLTSYMGWVKRHLKDDKVKGIIIAGKSDKKLDYALEHAPFDTDVFIYNVFFTLNEFKK